MKEEATPGGAVRSKGEWVGTVRNWMSRAPVHVASDVPVAHVAGRMRSEGIRHVLVMDGDVLAGVVSDRDVRGVRTEGESGGGPASPVARVMSEPVVTVDLDTPLVEAVRAMLEHKIGAVVVLDSDRPVGIVTRSDALEALLNAVESTGGRSSAPGGQA
jgi:CBS domain-containing protein